MSAKRWMLALFAASCLACLGESPTPDDYNLDDPPTDGGELNERECLTPEVGVYFCGRDGDTGRYICRDGDVEPTFEFCRSYSNGHDLCWGNRDTEPATCIFEAFYKVGGEGYGMLEPGSDYWLYLYDEREKAKPAEPTKSCCKVCRSGKACGGSCISKSKSCNVGPGCACNG